MAGDRDFCELENVSVHTSGFSHAFVYLFIVKCLLAPTVGIGELATQYVSRPSHLPSFPRSPFLPSFTHILPHWRGEEAPASSALR